MPYPPSKSDWAQVWTQKQGKDKVYNTTRVRHVRTYRDQLVDTPDFKHIVATGKRLPMNPYRSRTGEYNASLGSYLKSSTWEGFGSVSEAVGTTIISGAYNGAHNKFGSGYSALYAEANSKAVVNFYENANNSDFQALVTAAELPKTMSMIGQTAKRLAKAFKSAKRGDVGGLFQSLGLETGSHARTLTRTANNARKRGRLRDFASDSWLEVKYGWKPLLQDVESLAKATALGWQVEPADIVLRSRSRKKSDPYYVAGTATDLTVEGEASVKVSYTCTFSVIDQSTRNLQGLGLIDLGSVAWELIPYSFVVDWFVPVGSWIAAQNALAGTVFVEGCKTVHSEVDANATVYANAAGECNLTCSLKDFGIQRASLSAAPNVNLIISVPNWRSILKFDKAITGIALLHNAFGR